MEMDHTFVICAYKESAFLEECIRSLKAQTMQSKIIAVTHTPSAFLDEMMAKYEIPLIVNHGEGGITQDWNFGLKQITTRFATVAHQDDVYEPDYLKTLLPLLRKAKKPIIAFSEYAEIRSGVKTTDVKMLKIKRFMLWPLRFRIFWPSRFVRRRILSMGDPICCPAVTFDLERVERPIFENNFRCAEDWEAWEKLSRLKGSFIYIAKPLVCHRIYEESTTSEVIKEGGRIEENYIMFRKFWPAPIARFINKFYTKSEDSNNLEKK